MADIHIAASCGDLETVKWLLDNGTKVDARDKNNRTPMHQAAGTGKVEIMRYLKEHGADLYAKDDGNLSPMDSAIACEQIESIKCLKELGVDINARNDDGQTLMFIAAQAGYVKSIKCLAQLGADINARDNIGATPLILAAFMGQFECVKCLVNLGADVKAKAKNGMTPEESAKIDGHLEIVEWLHALTSIKCKDHPSKQAETSCEICKEPICKDCHTKYKFCYDCTTDSLKDEIKEYKDRRNLEKNKRIIVIVFSIIGLMIGLAIAATSGWSGASWIAVWILVGISGNFRVALSELPIWIGVYRKFIEEGKSFWSAFGQAVAGAIILLLLKSLAGPIIPLIKISEYTKNVKTAESTIANDTDLLTKLTDYYNENAENGNQKTYLESKLDANKSPTKIVFLLLAGILVVIALVLFSSSMSPAPPPAPSVKPLVPSINIDMVFVKGGIFTIGCTQEQGKDCSVKEKPVHSVTLNDFQIGKYEITQSQWVQVMGSNPSAFKGDNLPVENVSYNNAQEFISKLNSMTSKNYRLPTEAEWEYAARGGAKSKGYKYAGSNDIDEISWYKDNSDKRTHPVGTKQPNELGIYDMSGNVWEWVNNTNSQGLSSDSVVERGGSWNRPANRGQVSYLSKDSPNHRCYADGFRIAMSVQNTNSTTPSKYKYPQTSERLLTDSDLQNINKKDLRIMRNEIFARYGYIFKSEELKAYFKNQSWYTPKYSDVNSMLTNIEKKNIEFIKSHE